MDASQERATDDLASRIKSAAGAVLSAGSAQDAVGIMLATIADHIPDAVVVVDREGRITVVNQEISRISGYEEAELLGQVVDMLVPENRREAHRLHREGYYEKPRRRAMGIGHQLALRRKDGSTIPVDIQLSPIDLPDGLQVMVAIRDQSERLDAAETISAVEGRLAEAHRIAHIGTFSWDVESDSVLWSSELKQIYGFEPTDGPVNLDEYAALLHPEDRDRVLGEVQRAIDELGSYDHEYRILRADGQVRWMRANGEVAEVRDGRAFRVAGYCHDITERRRTEESLNRAVEDLSAYQLILERIARDEDLGVTLEDVCGEVEKRQPGAACSILLVEESDRTLRHAAGPSLPVRYLQAMDGLPIVKGLGTCGTTAATGEISVVEDVRTSPLTAPFLELADEFGLQSVWSYPLKSATGTILGSFAIYRRVTHRPGDDELAEVRVAADLASLAIERKKADDALTAAAQVDPLTGLPNRARFLEELQRQLETRKGFITVMFVDLDRFKWINDSLGHPVGDRILVEAAKRIRAAVPASSFVSRFGGDEFTIILTTANPTRVSAAAADLAQAFDSPFVLDGGEFFLTMSVGICSSERPTGAFEMIRDADAAMYAAKEQGRARHVWFDDRLRQRALDRLTIETRLRRAIERDEFVMHYQPVIDVRSGAGAGCEALVRWKPSGDETIAPSQFIPLAEETGLILPLGQLIFAKVLEDVADRRDLWPVAVNLSPTQLSDPKLPAWLRKVTDAAGVPPAQIVLELTESSLMEEFDRALPILRDLAESGFRLVIDDFGIGHWSIARLIEMPVSGIKIDQSFTFRLGVDPAAERVVAAIVELAHAIDLRVVSEGVETPGALEILARLGSDLAQGYYISYPLPIGDLPAPD